MILSKEIIQHKHFTEKKEVKTFKGKEITRSTLYIKKNDKMYCIGDIDHDQKELFIYSKNCIEAINEVKTIYSDYKIPDLIFAVGCPI